jgi:superfamily II DNA or RNA helicase/ribosomal protein S27AE
MLALRPYQARAVQAAREAIRSGKRAPLLVSPCGSGKSVMAAAIGLGAISKGSRLLWLAHRRELLAQARQHLRNAGVPDDAPFVVESPQTLLARDESTWPDARVVVLDEARHFCGTPEWSRVAAHYAGSIRVGLDATPCRSDGAPMGDTFDCLIPVATVRELQAAGHLVRYEVYGPAERKRAMAENPVDALARYAPTGRALVFARDVKHARKLAGEFTARGFPAACVEGQMRDRAAGVGVDRARDEAFDRFRAGPSEAGGLQVLVGVHVFTEGTDIPVADVAILARGIGHAGAMIQAVSRVGRPAPGKTRGIVLDLLGCSHEFGLPDEDRVCSLDGVPIRLAGKLDALRQCPACGGVFRAAEYQEAACPRCGYVVPGKPDPAVRRAAIGRILEGHSEEKRAERFAALVREGKARGYKRGWAVFRYRAMYGGAPPRERTGT